jgi:large subunit ribosomal protein L21
MYAIIRAGGHQEKVTVGEQITVDRLKERPGEQVRFVPLMVAKDDGTIVSDRKVLASEAAVVGVVLEHLKGEKVDVFQYRAKTGYRRHIGHRQPLTLVEISELRLGDTVERLEDKRAAEEAQRQALELERQAQEATRAEASKGAATRRKAASRASASRGGTGKGASQTEARKASARRAPAARRAPSGPGGAGPGGAGPGGEA